MRLSDIGLRTVVPARRLPWSDVRAHCRTGRHATSLAALIVVATFAHAAPALAADAPAWEVAAESFPTRFHAGGTGAYVLHVRNIGTLTSDGSTVTVVDRLPPGVTATSVDGEFVETEPTGEEYWRCSGTTIVTCTDNPANLPVIPPGPESQGGTAPYIVIKVAIEPGHTPGAVTSSLSVNGGGASEARNIVQTIIGSSAAGFGLASFEQLFVNRDGSPDVQAGSHPYEAITNFVLNSHGQFGEPRVLPEEVKDLEIGLPPGVVGNPAATPRCPRTLFDGGRHGSGGFPACPADTRVGTDVLVLGLGGEGNFPLVLAVYNLEPPRDVVAQFGFAFQDRVGFIDFGIRTGEDYAVKAVLRNIVQAHVLRNALVLWGQPTDASHDTERGGSVPPSSVPLLTVPTSCGSPLNDLTSMDSWELPAPAVTTPFSLPVTTSYPVTNNRGDQITMQGCSKLEFDPSFEVAPEKTATSTPTGLSVKLNVPQNRDQEGLATAHLKDAVVTLPAGLTVSPSVANGLQACSPEQIGLTDGHEPSCPDASRIGTVTAHTPLLSDPLTGSVYVAEQTNNPFGSLLAIYLTAQSDGALVKFAGHVQANPATGQLTVSFDENPQLPFSDLTVNVTGGPRAALMTPASCGVYSTTTQLTGYNGALSTPAISPFRISTGCVQGFSPSFTAGTSGNVAGAFGSFSTTISRADTDQPLDAISVTTPPGMLGMLSHIPLCPDAEASTDACPAASLIGHTTETAGPGPDSVTVTGGRVFLTGPYEGAPFGLSIVVPAVAGPFNLGDVRIRATIHVDPATGQLTILSDPLPTILDGIPLDVRAINVNIDRPEFTFNPTNCAPLASTATITSSHGATAMVSSRFQVADCASLPFKPRFTAFTTAKTSKLSGASLTVQVAQAPGQANIAQVHLQLPKVLPSRLTTLQKACTESQFDSNPAGCPAGAMIGYAKAVTPVLNVPLVGPAILVSHGGAAFPDVEFILQGQGVTVILDGKTQIKKGITYSHFDTVPDAPITSFETVLPQGPHSILAAFLPAKANGSLCTSKLVMPTTITAQNGAVIKQNTRITVTGCPRAKKAHGRAGKRAR